MTTTLLKESEIQRDWFLVDATDRPAGRLAVEIARILRGKHKPTFAPHMDIGDFVVVINAEKVKLTGAKEEQKIYKHYTGYQSGLKEFTAKTVRERNPERIIESAVKGMLPKTNLGRKLFKKLKVYAGTEHPHEAQRPKPIEL